MFGAVRGCQEGVKGCRGVTGVLGTGRDCRYSEAKRGIGGIRENWGLLQGVGGCYGAS